MLIEFELINPTGSKESWLYEDSFVRLNPTTLLDKSFTHLGDNSVTPTYFSFAATNANFKEVIFTLELTLISEAFLLHVLPL